MGAWSSGVWGAGWSVGGAGHLARAALPRPQPLVVKTSPVARAPQDVEPKLHHGNYIGVNGFEQVSARIRRCPSDEGATTDTGPDGQVEGRSAAVASGPMDLPHVLAPHHQLARRCRGPTPLVPT